MVSGAAGYFACVLRYDIKWAESTPGLAAAVQIARPRWASDELHILSEAIVCAPQFALYLPRRICKQVLALASILLRPNTLCATSGVLKFHGRAGRKEFPAENTRTPRRIPIDRSR